MQRNSDLSLAPVFFKHYLFFPSFTTLFSKLEKNLSLLQFYIHFLLTLPYIKFYIIFVCYKVAEKKKKIIQMKIKVKQIRPF